MRKIFLMFPVGNIHYLLVCLGGRPGDVSWTEALPNLVYVAWKIDGDLSIARAYYSKLLSHLANVEAQAAQGKLILHRQQSE